MREHVTRPVQRKGSRQSVGIRELKTHTAHILRQVREARASYLLTHRGQAIGVILPVDSEDEGWQASEAGDATAAWEAFLQAGRRLERRFRARRRWCSSAVEHAAIDDDQETNGSSDSNHA